jgi:hypothetical protein
MRPLVSFDEHDLVGFARQQPHRSANRFLIRCLPGVDR